MAAPWIGVIYVRRMVHLSMSEYVKDAQVRFAHKYMAAPSSMPKKKISHHCWTKKERNLCSK